jgi:acyltransferase
MEKKKRIDWIDASRGVSILGVIAFHTGFLPFITIIDPILMSWILPVFLFTGGWLLKNTPFTLPRVIVRIRRMLVPFFIAGAVSFLGWIFLRTIYPQQILNQPINRELIKWWTGRNPYFNSPLWFIPTYLAASIFMQAIAVWWFRRRIVTRGICSMFFVVAGFFLSRPFHYPVFSYDLVLLFIGMIMMGSVASTVSFPKIVPRVVFDVVALVLFLVVSVSNGYIDMFQRQFGNPLLFMVSATLGTYSVARFCFRRFAGLGRASMSLLVWHWPIMQWLTYGLFISGVLNHLVQNFTKTSFVLNAVGCPSVILQLAFCGLYAGVAFFCIFAIKRIVRLF